MARAKRTDRAEARRRHRAQFAESLPEGDLDEATEEAGPSAGRSTGPRTGAATAEPPPPVRPGIAKAFRQSFRPVDLRGDLRALPRTLRHWSFLIAVILSGVSVALVPLLGANTIALTMFGYFSGAAPIGSAFLAGFFAPRASYLSGALAGLASVAFMALAFSVGSFGDLLPTQTIDGTPLAPDVAKALVLNQALFYGVPSAALFASMAAWYRRFLNLANPNRRRRPPTPTGRRPDGRQPRKNQQRPMLARRR